jgi:hypothetical protein
VVAAEDDDYGVKLALFQLLEQLKARPNAGRGRLDLEQENVRVAFAEHLVRRVVVVAFQHFKVGPPQRASDPGAFLRVALDYPYFSYGFDRRHGR